MLKLISEELGVSQRIVIAGSEVMPRFRVMTSEGDYLIFTQRHEEAANRDRRISLIAQFMEWKQANGFVLSAASKDPEAISTLAVTRSGCAGALRLITRRPISFSPVRELGPQDIDAGLTGLLPKRRRTLTWVEQRALEITFGPMGEMPAQRLF